MVCYSTGSAGLGQAFRLRSPNCAPFHLPWCLRREQEAQLGGHRPGEENGRLATSSALPQRGDEQGEPGRSGERFNNRAD